jgi:hypothetical protein
MHPRAVLRPRDFGRIGAAVHYRANDDGVTQSPGRAGDNDTVADLETGVSRKAVVDRDRSRAGPRRCRIDRLYEKKSD